MAEWLGRWTCNLVLPGLRPSPCYSLELFLVALVCLLPVGIFNHFVFYLQCLFLFVGIGLKSPIGGVAS